MEKIQTIKFSRPASLHSQRGEETAVLLEVHTWALPTRLFLGLNSRFLVYSAECVCGSLALGFPLALTTFLQYLK